MLLSVTLVVYDVVHRKNNREVTRHMTSGEGARSALAEQIVAVQRAVRAKNAVDIAVPGVHPDVTPRQLKTLLLLYSNSEPTASMGWIARSLGVTLPTVTGIIDRLAEQGFVSRRDDPNDRRLVLAALTEKGHGVIDGWYEQFDGFLNGVLENLTEDELDTVARALTLILNAASRVKPAAG